MAKRRSWGFSDRAVLRFAALIWVAAGCSLDHKGLSELPSVGSGGAGNGPTSTGTGGSGTGGHIIVLGSGGAPIDPSGTGGAIAAGTGGNGTGGLVGTGGVVASGGVPAARGGAPGGQGGLATVGGGGASGASGGGGAGNTAGRGGGAGGGGAGGHAAATCGPATCMNGCCENNVCVTTHAVERCGLNGVVCSACAKCFRCGAAGTCEVSPTSSWKLVCSAANLAATMPNGDDWDSGSGFGGPGGPSPGPGGPSPGSGNAALPDPYCSLEVGLANAGAETSILENTLTPAWNETISPPAGVTASVLMAQTMPWSITVSDDDSRMSVDQICQVTPKLSQADFVSANVTFTDVQSCRSLSIRLVCQD